MVKQKNGNNGATMANLGFGAGPWRLPLAASAMLVACAICAPAKAQSADAVYSNLGTFQNQSFAAGGATQQVLNTITRMAADDLNLDGTPPYSVNGFRFTVTNLNAVDVSASPLVRFYRADGPSGGPGTLIAAFTYNPIVFSALSVGKVIKTSTKFVLPSSSIWAGIAFDNNGGTTGATAAQLDNLALGIFSPPEVGTSTDRYFVTTDAGSFASDNPVGTLQNFGGAPPADFGWEMLTAQDVNLSITNSDGVDTAFPGGSVTYTITASNAGPQATSGARVVDLFPATLTCSWTCAGSAGNTCAASGAGDINDATVDLAAGGSVTYTATCAVSPAATGTLVNTAGVFAPGTAVEAGATDNLATDTDTIGISADLAITKTDGVTTATPGGSVTYTITASNAGPGEATGATVADTFPAPLTCTWTCVGAGGGTCTAAGSGNVNDTVNLPAGGSVTYTASCTIAAAATGTLSNTATVGAPGGVTDPNPANNSATDTDTLDAQADLAITKTDGVTTATAGGSVTYTITASNAGPSNATGATVADTFPAPLTCTWTCVGAGGGTCTAAGSGNVNDTVNLPTGGSVTYTASCTIAAAATGTLSNTATVTAPAGVTDPTPGNNSATDTDTLTPQADLAITKTDGVTTATAGGSVTYTITASNAGPSNATGATVADTFPAPLTCTWTCVGAGGGTCTAAGSGNVNDTVNLPAGGSVTYTASCTIAAAATGTLSNTATVTAPAGVTDPTPGNNSATDTDTLTPQADLAITKTDGVTTATAGGSVTYTITASNAGPSDATGATVADTFPAPLTCTWTCVGAGGGTCTAAGSGNVNDTVNLPTGGSVTYTASCTIAAAATGTLSNTATVTAPAGVTDPTPGNNSATDTDTLTPQADLAITKTDGVTTATPGGSVTYTITASNAGPSNATGATVADTFPAPLTCTWTCVGAGGGTCTAAGSGNVNDTVNLPAGGSVTYTASCTIAAAATGTLSNTATVGAPGGVTDPNPANNSATDTDTLAAPPPVTIFSGPSATGSGTITASFPAVGNCTFTGPQYIGPPPGAPPIPPTVPNGGVTFPHGLFDFSVTGCAAGATVVITITYPQPLPNGTSYYKYGPTLGNPAPLWYILPAVIAGNTATFTITDGGLGDDDLAANGTIVDQGGPGVPPTGAGVVAQIPTLSQWAILLLALLLLGFAAPALRPRS